MYFNKGNLSRFIFGFSILLAVTVTLIFIIQRDNASVINHATLRVSQEKSESSAMVIPSNKNRPQVKGISSSKTKRADEISNLKLAQSKLLKKISALELIVSKLLENQYASVIDEDEYNENAVQDNKAEKHDEMEKAVLGPIVEEIELIEAIQSEPVDAEWSDSAIDTLYKTIERNTNGSVQILNVDCRNTLCRVELMVNSTSQEEGLKELEKISPPWNSEGFFEIDELGSGRAVMYIAREGHYLPRLQE